MKNFWSSFLAALLAFVLGSIITQCIALFAFIGFMAMAISPSSNSQVTSQIPDESILKLEIGNLPEKRQDLQLDFYKKSSSNPTLTDILRAIERAKKDNRIEGIYIHSPLPLIGMASLLEIREAIEDFKTSGKWVVSYADQYSQTGYYLSSVADELYINPQGMIELKGLSTASLFYRKALEKIGVEVTVLKVGTYKGAVEPFLLDQFSEANKEQIQSYMQGLWSEISNKVSESRGIALDSLEAIVNRGPLFFAPEEYKTLSLADDLLYEREVINNLKEKVGLDEKDELDFVSPMQLLSTPSKTKATNGTVAVCYAEGVINSSEANSPFANNVITEQLATELINYANNDDIDAVVLRVNSPGGSAFVSDQIWDAVKFLRTKKPLVVSMGDYAASGGYYISCAADYIVAEPVTITGSIGIYGMIPNLSRLADKVDLKQDVVKTHQYADALSSIFRSMTPAEKERMQAYIERGYDTFISRVAEGRKMTKAQVDSVGQGRVWTGKQALEKNLVDELGGLQIAIKKAASLANLDSNYRIMYVNRESINLQNFYNLFLNNMSEKLMLRLLTPEELESIKETRNLRSLEGAQALLPYEIGL